MILQRISGEFMLARLPRYSTKEQNGNVGTDTSMEILVAEYVIRLRG